MNVASLSPHVMRTVGQELTTIHFARSTTDRISYKWRMQIKQKLKL